VFTGEGTATGNNNFTATFHNRSTTSLTGQTDNGAGGIAIRIDAATPNVSNDFVRFINGAGATVGRIEGQTVANLPSDSEHLHFVRELNYAIDNAEYQVQSASFQLALEIAEGVIGGAEIVMSGSDAAARVTCAVGTFGACTAIAATGAAHTVLKIANAVKFALNIVNAGLDLDDAISTKNAAERLKCDYDTMVVNNIGVTYESGSADYAEWLPKNDLTEKFDIADIVGVKGGKISKNTIGAEQFMVVSMRPIVLGNTPEKGKSKEYEKVAFMGQVPVRVLGKVNLGDYILPSGGNNGLGVALSPANMKAEDYKKIVGVAWSVGNSADLNVIKVAVGLNTNSLASVIEKQAQEIRSLQLAINKSDEKMDQINSTLAMLVPGYKKAMNMPENTKTQSKDYLDEVLGNVQKTKKEQNVASATSPIKSSISPIKTSITPVNSSIKSVSNGKSSSEQVNVPSAFFTDDIMKEAFEMAEKNAIAAGEDMSTHPFFSKIASDPAYREIAMKKIQNELNKTAIDQLIINGIKKQTNN